jgi:hypothetical protein
MILNVFKAARIVYAGSRDALMIKFISSCAFIMIYAVTCQLMDPATSAAVRHEKKYSENMESRFPVFRQKMLKDVIFKVEYKAYHLKRPGFNKLENT